MNIVIATVPNEEGTTWDFKFIMVDGHLTHSVIPESVHYVDGYIDGLELVKHLVPYTIKEVEIKPFEMEPEGMDEDDYVAHWAKEVNAQIAQQ